MVVLGLSCFGHNPAAAVLVDGTLIAFAEEERFVRIKEAFGRFPSYAVRYCLKEAKLSLGDIDRIAVGWDATKYPFFMPVFFTRVYLGHRTHTQGHAYGSIFSELFNQQPGTIKQKITLELRGVGHRGALPSIEFIPHHLAHAASVFYASGFNKAAIVVIDGSGEERATSMFVGQGRHIQEKQHINIPDSLGWFYTAITAYLGFRAREEEGFVMGLAPYGRPHEKFTKKIQHLLSLEKHGTYRVDPSYTLLGLHEESQYYSEELVRLLGPARLPEEPITQRHKDIAYAAQAALEQAGLSLVRHATQNGAIRTLCLAGGVALNCKMNGVIAQSGLVDELFIQPASNDAGAALGAAMVVAERNGDDPRFRMEHAQWGPQYSHKAIQKMLDTAGVAYMTPASIEKKVARAIAKGNVVAWFDGRMEIGPRALGGRSILADPRRASMKDHLNTKVKYRESWRPYCPSIVKESAAEYLEYPKEARFMTVAYPVPSKKQTKIAAAVHIDGTTRPQTVDKKILPRFWSLLDHLNEEIGLPAVLNTSLNVKGEPIACTPLDALRSFVSTGIDAMAIEECWIEKS